MFGNHIESYIFENFVNCLNKIHVKVKFKRKNYNFNYL